MLRLPILSQNQNLANVLGPLGGGAGESGSTQSLYINGGAGTGYYLDTDQLMSTVAAVRTFTIQCWMKPDTVASLDFIFGDGPTVYGAGSNIYATGADDLRYRANSSQDVNNLNNFTATAWHHVVLVRDGDNGHLYVDNNKISNASMTLTPTSSNTIEVGGGGDDGASDLPTRCFEGRITDFVIWNIALNDSQVTTLYNSGSSTGNGGVATANIALQYTFDQPGDTASSITDISGNNYTGTVRQTASGNATVTPSLTSDVP